MTRVEIEMTEDPHTVPSTDNKNGIDGFHYRTFDLDIFISDGETEEHFIAKDSYCGQHIPAIKCNGTISAQQKFITLSLDNNDKELIQNGTWDDIYFVVTAVNTSSIQGLPDFFISHLLQGGGSKSSSYPTQVGTDEW
jgi:hypothetical protein